VNAVPGIYPHWAFANLSPSTLGGDGDVIASGEGGKSPCLGMVVVECKVESVKLYNV
jgi:hypothetical protein